MNKFALVAYRNLRVKILYDSQYMKRIIEVDNDSNAREKILEEAFRNGGAVHGFVVSGK